MRIPYNKMSQLQTVEVGICLKEHCHLSNGVAIYDTGWSDEVITKRFNLTSLTAVPDLRRKLIGQLPTTRDGTAVNKLIGRLEDLEKRVATLEELLEGLTK